MSDLAIRVENLGKAYRIGLKEQQHETLLGAVAAWAKSPFRNFRDVRNLSRFDEPKTEDSSPVSSGARSGDPPSVPPQLSAFSPQPSADIIWALRDVSFEVKHGEAVGIIGRNGAGKSTLLKILCRITEPTTGRAEIHGRVGCLLEVGTGFHPDLTGRENVYLNGTILGMKKREVDAKFDEIVEFSGVEEFIDTPVKRYSSGMRVRLAFSVAAYLEPEILVVDEVLAVGDAAFQRKCLGKMGDVARAGRTVLFVSHNMQAVNGLCKRAITLERGIVTNVGDSGNVVHDYLERLMSEDLSTSQEQWKGEGDALEAGGIRLHSVRIGVADGSSRNSVTTAEPFNLEVEYSNLLAGRPLLVSTIFYSLDGTEVFQSNTIRDLQWSGKAFPCGRFRSTCRVPGELLNEGQFRIRVMFHNVDTMTSMLDCKEALVISVHDVEERAYLWFGRYKGVVHPRLPWDTRLLPATSEVQRAKPRATSGDEFREREREV